MFSFASGSIASSAVSKKAGGRGRHVTGGDRDDPLRTTTCPHLVRATYGRVRAGKPPPGRGVFLSRPSEGTGFPKPHGGAGCLPWTPLDSREARQRFLSGPQEHDAAGPGTVCRPSGQAREQRATVSIYLGSRAGSQWKEIIFLFGRQGETQDPSGKATGTATATSNHVRPNWQPRSTLNCEFKASSQDNFFDYYGLPQKSWSVPWIFADTLHRAEKERRMEAIDALSWVHPPAPLLAIFFIRIVVGQGKGVDLLIPSRRSFPRRRTRRYAFPRWHHLPCLCCWCFLSSWIIIWHPSKYCCCCCGWCCLLRLR